MALSLVFSVSAFGIANSFKAMAEEAELQSFIDDSFELIKENDEDKNFVVDNSSEISTLSTNYSETENHDFQTCRLIVKSDKEIEKLNSVGVASGFQNFYIVQFASETDTIEAFEYYSECDYVISVSPDRVYSVTSDYTVDDNNKIIYEKEFPDSLEFWGSKTTGVKDLKDYIESNYNVSSLPEIIVGVIDSGVDLNHEFLQGRLIPTGYNATDDGQENSEHDVIEGHGTSVSSVIADNTTSNIKIKSYRVTDDDGYTTSATISNAILQAYHIDEIKLINISLCCSSTSEAEWDLFNSTVNDAYEAGCLIVTGAGNYNVDIDYNNSIPASCNLVITAAASGETNLPTSWSSRGDSVDIMAPGDNVPVAIPNNEYKLTSGTSFSSPLTVAVLAMLKTLYPEESPKQLEVRLESSAGKCDLEYVVNMYGYGIIDAIGAAGLERADSPVIKNEHDVYSGKAEIKISHSENCTVYYTIDQTYPSKENGILYESPIEIEGDNFIIHAIAYGEEGFRSEYASENVKSATLGTNDMFEISEDGIVTAYDGDVLYLEIPERINGINVTGFAENVFSEAEFYGVLFPESVNTVSSKMFYGNTTLQYVDGLGITEIEDSAFYNCTGLYVVNFPKVQLVGKNAFYNTRQLSGIDFYECTFIDQYAFYNSIIRYINIPKTKVIAAYAFQDCDCIYKFYAPSLTELRGRLFDGEQWYAGSNTFRDAGLHFTVDLKNISKTEYGCFYQAKVKRIEFSMIEGIDRLPITYCKSPYYGNITLALPSTLKSCGIDMIPGDEQGVPYDIKYKIFCSEGTYAERWANDNGYEVVILNQENASEAVITDLPAEYYSYMRPLEADVIGFNKIYQWYGADTPSYENSVAIKGATEKELTPDNCIKEYKYYYCIVTSTDIGFDPVTIRTGICENKTYNIYNPPKSNGKVTIAAPSTRYIKYGESVKLYANATGLPEGAKIKWRIVDGSGVSLDVSTTGKICTVTSKSNGDVIIEAYAVNSNGNVLVNESGNRICDREGISSEVSLWWIFLYYIRQLLSISNAAINSLL